MLGILGNKGLFSTKGIASRSGITSEAMLKIFGDMDALLSNIDASSSNIVPMSSYRDKYRINRAQVIRNKSGVPSTQTAGNITGSTVGLTDAGALVSQNNSNLTNEAAVQAFADSGSGTQEDPYIIRDRDYDQGGGTGLNLSEVGGAYYVKCVNCRFGSNTTAAVLNDLATPIELENCEITQTVSGANMLRIDEGGCILTNCYVKALNCSNFILLQNSADANVSITVQNCKFDTSDADWPSTPRIIHANNFTAGGLTVNWNNNYVDLTSATGQPEGFIEAGDRAITLNASNNYWRGGENFINQNALGGAPLALWTLTALYNDVDETLQEAVLLVNVTGEIGYSDYAHSTTGAGYRVIYLNGDGSNSGVNPHDLDCHHLKITKQTGSGIGTPNECIFSRYGKNVVFRDSWVPECTEDAFEHVSGISGNKAYNLVGDNVTGEVVDIFKQWDETTWSEVTDASSADNSNTYVAFIYGDCDWYGMSIEAIRGVYGHDVYVDNTGSTDKALIRLDDAAGTTDPYDIYFAGALTLPENRAGEAAIFSAGSNVEFNFYDNLNGTGALTILYDGMVLWLDSSDTSTITEASGAVSQWDDKTGNGNHATQSSGSNRPTTGSRTYNGMNVIDFDGSTSFLDLSSGLYSVPSGSNTLFVVYKSDVDTISTQRVFNGTVSGSTRWAIVHHDSSARRVAGINHTGFVPVPQNITDDDDERIVVTRRDGSTLTIGCYDGSNTGAAASVTVDNLELGRFVGGSDYLDGFISEVVVFDKALTDDQINKFGENLSLKWNVGWENI